jgi:hypothetical protein
MWNKQILATACLTPRGSRADIWVDVGHPYWNFLLSWCVEYWDGKNKLTWLYLHCLIRNRR